MLGGIIDFDLFLLKTGLILLRVYKFLLLMLNGLLVLRIQQYLSWSLILAHSIYINLIIFQHEWPFTLFFLFSLSSVKFWHIPSWSSTTAAFHLPTLLCGTISMILSNVQPPQNLLNYSCKSPSWIEQFQNLDKIFLSISICPFFDEWYSESVEH